MGFDGSSAGACGDLRQVHDDVGRADVGNGVLLRVVMGPGGTSCNGGGRCGCDCHRRGWWRGRWGCVHDFDRGLKRKEEKFYKE